MTRKFTLLALILGFFVTGLASAQATTKVRQIRSPGGIEAWLVRETSIPIIAVHFAFAGSGAAQDPQGKEGLSQLMVSLLDEGAGPYDARSFQEKLQTLAISIGFDVDKDNLTGSLQTLSANRDTAFELLRLAINEPRFDADAIERMRTHILTAQREETNDPERQALYAFTEAAFSGHPYGRRRLGTESTVRALTRDDILGRNKNILARDNLKITVVGDIEEAELGRALDKIFSPLPQKAMLVSVPEVKMQGQGRRIVVDLKGPQSQMIFGQTGPKRRDLDFMASYLLNHMLGGSSFSSRLYKELREKRGLTYGIYTSLSTLDHAGLFEGTLATRNDTAAEALKLVQQEVDRFRKEGPTEQELKDTKSYVIGYYPLSFDTTGKIASLLLGLQLDGFTPDYLTEREKLINAVTLEDIKRAAEKLFKEPFLVVVAGQPKGLETN